MFIAICYDVPDNRRRNRIAKILEGFGSRVQESVFECDITLKQLERLKSRLNKVIKGKDNIRIYYLCRECIGRVEIINGPPITRTPPYFVV